MVVAGAAVGEAEETMAADTEAGEVEVVMTAEQAEATVVGIEEEVIEAGVHLGLVEECLCQDTQRNYNHD